MAQRYLPAIVSLLPPSALLAFGEGDMARLGPPRSYPSGSELLAQRARYQAEVIKEYEARITRTPVAPNTYSSAPDITNEEQRKVRAEDLARRREEVEERIRERIAALPALPSVRTLSRTLLLLAAGLGILTPLLGCVTGYILISQVVSWSTVRLALPALTQFTIARAVVFTVVVAVSGCVSMLGGIQSGQWLGSQWDQFRNTKAAREEREVKVMEIEAEARAAVLREEEAEAVSRHKEAAMERAKQIVGQRIREQGHGTRGSGKTNKAASRDLGFGGPWRGH